LKRTTTTPGGGRGDGGDGRRTRKKKKQKKEERGGKTRTQHSGVIIILDYQYAYCFKASLLPHSSTWIEGGGSSQRQKSNKIIKK
jgi:hypothetical protein